MIEHVTQSVMFQARQEALDMAHTHLTANADEPPTVRALMDTAEQYYVYLLAGIPRHLAMEDEESEEITATTDKDKVKPVTPFDQYSEMAKALYLLSGILGDAAVFDGDAGGILNGDVLTPSDIRRVWHILDSVEGITTRSFHEMATQWRERADKEFQRAFGMKPPSL